MGKHVINQQQLQMFMKPSELRQTLTGSVDQQHVNDPTQDWPGKTYNRGLRQSIASEGIRKPVILDHSTSVAGISNHNWRSNVPPVIMGNGHNRVQTAKELEDQGREVYVPVLHVDNDYMGDLAGKHYSGLSDWSD